MQRTEVLQHPSLLFLLLLLQEPESTKILLSPRHIFRFHQNVVRVDNSTPNLLFRHFKHYIVISYKYK